MLRASHLLGWMAFAVLGCHYADAFSADAVAHAELKGDYARIVISGDQPVRFQSRSEGNRLVLNFDSPTHVDLSSLGALKPYVTGSSMAADGKTATLTLNGAYGTRHFLSGNASGLDLLGLPASAPATPPVAAKPTTAPSPAAPGTIAATPVEKSIATRNGPMPWLNKAAPESTIQAEPIARPTPPAAPAVPVVAAPAPAAKPIEKVDAAAVHSTPAKASPQAIPTFAANLPQAIAKPKAPIPPKPPVGKKNEESTVSFTPITNTHPAEDARKDAAAAKAAQAKIAQLKGEPKTEKIIQAEKVVKAETPVVTEISEEQSKKEDAEKAAKDSAEKEKTAKELADKEAASKDKAKKEEDDKKAAADKKEKEEEDAEAAKDKEIAKAAEDKKAADDEKAEAEKRKAAVEARLKEEEIPSAPVHPQTGGQAGDFIVTVDARKTAAEFYFPWKERVASAVFTRGNYLFVVFNEEAKVDVGMLKTILPNFVESVEQLPAPGFTVLRLKGTTNINAHARKATGNYNWIVALSRRNGLPETPVVPQTQVDPPQKPSIFLPVLETAKPAEIKNPENGETLIVVPVYKDGVGVFPERSFVDVTFLRTAQGVAVVKKNSALRISRLLNGLRVSTPQGLMLSGNIPQLNLQDFISAEDNSLTLFPYALWKVDDRAGFDQRRKQILRQISESTDDKASFHRLNLAQLYLGENLNAEALAILNLIQQTDPDFYASYQLAGLHGAANFMLQRYNAAATDFNDASLEGEDEIEFWKDVTALMQGATNKSIKYATNEKQYIRNYPPDMRRRLAIIAADQMLSKKRYNTALRFLNMLADDKLLKPVKEYADALIGRIYFDMNKYDLSRKMLQPLADNSKKRYIRSNAEFYLASMDFQEGKINRKELIHRLDRLRMVWRGDSLEPTVLAALGDLYVQENEYISALRTWRDLTRSYPDIPGTQDTLIRMSQTFVDLFNKGRADSLPPIEALAIYYEFRDLTPVDSTGDHMIQNLADRLAAVDLLDRAAALLEHQVTYRLQREDRSRVGARLAMIYLLNKQPQMAVDALERTGYGNNPPSLERQRNQIAATAYSQLNDGQTALALLRNDKSTDAKDIRMDIYWNGKDWQNVIATGEAILASRSDITAPLSLHETQTLLRLAIAYSFTRDTLQLQYLRDYFSPLINDAQRKEVFTFITNNLEPVDNRNIMQLTQQLSNMQNFIENYHTRIAEQGLSKAVN